MVRKALCNRMRLFIFEIQELGRVTWQHFKVVINKSDLSGDGSRNEK